MRFPLETLIAATVLVGCGDSETTSEPAAVPTLERGEYLAEALGPCGQCHTPKGPDGKPDDTKHYGGNDCFIDITPEDDNAGCLATPNITNHATGIAKYTDAELKVMITQGLRPDGSAMFPIMPYFVIHTYPDMDVDSIILYLRSLPPVDHPVAANQLPFSVPISEPAPPLTEEEMPLPTVQNEATMRGRFLGVAACLQCHTPLTEVTDFRTLDKTKLFAGGNPFGAAVLGYATPPLPTTIYSTNLTPDPTTGAGYSKEQLISLLKTGKDKTGVSICPPMPIGDAYGKLTDADLSDMADYLLAVPAIQNTIANTCAGP